MHVLIFLINVAATLDKKEYKIYVKKNPKQNKTEQHQKKIIQFHMGKITNIRFIFWRWMNNV